MVINVTGFLYPRAMARAACEKLFNPSSRALLFCDWQPSIKFEGLVTQPLSVLELVFNDLEIDDPDWDRVLSIIAAPKMGQGRDSAPERWIMDIEAECEEEMQLFLGWEGDDA